MRSYLAVALVSVAACATASKGDGTTDASGKRDSNNQQFFDAPGGQIDAPNSGGPDSAIAVTLSETGGSTTVAAGQTISCNNGINTSDNIWYRAYQLSDFPGVTGGLHITGITFGIEECSAAGTITVKIGSYTGSVDTLNTAMISALQQATTSPADATNATVTVPIVADIAAGGKFVVQVSAPASTTGYFVLGTTTTAESHPGYWSSAGCSQSTPETTTAATQSTHNIIDVVGTH